MNSERLRRALCQIVGFQVCSNIVPYIRVLNIFYWQMAVTRFMGCNLVFVSPLWNSGSVFSGLFPTARHLRPSNRNDFSNMFNKIHFRGIQRVQYPISLKSKNIHPVRWWYHHPTNIEQASTKSRWNSIINDQSSAPTDNMITPTVCVTFGPVNIISWICIGIFPNCLVRYSEHKIYSHMTDTVESVLRDHCHDWPPVLKDHIYSWQWSHISIQMNLSLKTACIDRPYFLWTMELGLSRQVLLYDQATSSWANESKSCDILSYIVYTCYTGNRSHSQPSRY